MEIDKAKGILEQVEKVFCDVAVHKANKAQIDGVLAKITAYQVGEMVRIDIREKQ